MNSLIPLSYARTPSQELRKLLLQGFLSPLLSLSGRESHHCRLDIHFRAKDHVYVYCGRARILDVVLDNKGTVKVTADPKYKKNSEILFRQWKPDATGFETALHDYLDNLKVDNKWTGNEGRVQDFWSHLEEGPWTPFDREAAVHYGTKEAAAQGAQFTDVQRARSILEEIARARPNRDGKPWQEPSKASGRQQLDQLGIDKHGNLVLVELKDASSKSFSSVFYAPLQLLGYVHEWCAAFRWEHIRCQLNDLIDARKQLGLISPEVVPLTGGIRAAICFGKDKRSDEVKRRFYEALGVVNSHRPPGVQPFEAWSLAARDEAPQSL